LLFSVQEVNNIDQSLLGTKEELNTQKDTSTLNFLSTKSVDCKMSEEYKGFADKFDKDFGDDEKEATKVLEHLNKRAEQIENYTKELAEADVDMLFFKNKLARELSDIYNDIKEAYNSIMILMNDRSIIKDQFCILHIKIKKLKEFNKLFQEDFQAYFLLRG